MAQPLAAAADEALVEQALAGSQDAYRELVLRYQRPIFTLILRMVREAPVAEELAQDAFVKAFGRLVTYDPAHKLSSWLFKIAHNTAIDHLRRRVPETVPLERPEQDGADLVHTLADPSAISPETAASNRDLARGLEAAIARLRPEYRAVIVLRFQEELAYEEIAVVTGLPLGTVKTHIHRARKELARLLSEPGDGRRGETGPPAAP